MGKLVAIDEDGSERFTTTFAQIPQFDNRFLGADWTADGRLALGGTTVNHREDGILSGAWIVDMSDAVPELDPGPSIWETQHPGASAGGDDGDSGGDGENSGGDSDAAASGGDAATGAREPTAGASSADVVLFAATALSAVALFVPYGVRRFRRR